MIQPQTLLKFHTPCIPQHHVQALPSPQPHDMFHVQPTPMQITGKRPPECMRIACSHRSSLSEVVAYLL